LSISRQLPPLEFYIKLFDKCKFTISPLSTMNLESILFGIPTIALDFQEKQLPNSPWATDFFEHFSELRKYDGVRIVRSNGELVSAINALYKSKVRIVRKLIADYDLSMKFDERILHLIDDKT
jgi:predicted glycosyltransferase